MISTSLAMSSNHTLLSLITLNPFDNKYLSLRDADFFRSLPHLYGESISIHSFFDGIKKSILYEPIGSCIEYCISNFSKIALKYFSCGKSFLINVLEIVFALLLRVLIQLMGCLIFILREDASFLFLNINPLDLANLTNTVCETPHSLDNEFNDLDLPQCKSDIILLNGMLKCFSIFSLYIGYRVYMQEGKVSRGFGKR